MPSRSLIIMFIAAVLVATVAGGLVGWGLSSATLAGAHGPAGAAGAAGAKGEPGANGADGTAGAQGEPGATGATGATGPKGATGATGSTGAPGPQGNPGVAGTNGTNASIATFSFTSATGVFPPVPFPIQVATMTDAIPAGPALIGFSMSLNTLSPFSPVITCGLYDQASGLPLATASPVTLQTNVSATTALTQVVTLAASTTLTLECSASGPGVDFVNYSNLSIYGLSFATS